MLTTSMYPIIYTYNLGDIMSHVRNCVPIPTLLSQTPMPPKKGEERRKKLSKDSNHRRQ